MSSPNNKPKLAAKAVQMVYGFPGNLQKGWEAERTGESTYMIHRSNGTSREVNLYEPIRTAKGDLMPMRNDHGLLTIGDWSVLIGRNINHAMHARKLSEKNAYLVMGENNKQIGKVKIGEQFEGTPVSLVDGHLLKVGENTVPVMPKKYDITLLVMDKEIENGLQSFINMIEIGNQSNRKDGARGILIRPKQMGEPAQFVETHAGQKVVTAMFWLEKNEKSVTFAYRDAHAALQANMLSKKLQEARDVAINAGIEPDEYHEYCELLKKLDACNKAWRKEGMALSVGPSIFKPKSLDRRHDPSIGL
jgi:hypothetical protein